MSVKKDDLTEDCLQKIKELRDKISSFSFEDGLNTYSSGSELNWGDVMSTFGDDYYSKYSSSSNSLPFNETWSSSAPYIDNSGTMISVPSINSPNSSQVQISGTGNFKISGTGIYNANTFGVSNLFKNSAPIERVRTLSQDEFILDLAGEEIKEGDIVFVGDKSFSLYGGDSSLDFLPVLVFDISICKQEFGNSVSRFISLKHVNKILPTIGISSTFSIGSIDIPLLDGEESFEKITGKCLKLARPEFSVHLKNLSSVFDLRHTFLSDKEAFLLSILQS
jgi:hypothetical protein